MLTELDMYSFVRSRLLSRGRYDRTREISLDLPDETIAKIRKVIELNFGTG